MGFSPRPHQERAVELLRTSLSRVQRTILVAPTGAGKTFIAFMLAKLALDKGNRVLIIAPKRDLINQTYEKFSLYGLSYYMTKLMAGYPYHQDMPVVVASADTLWSRGFRNERIDPPDAQLVLIDECHLFGGKARSKLLARYSMAKTVGLTATPVGANGVGLGNNFQDLVHAATYRELTDAGVLVPVEIYCPNRVDMSGVSCGDVSTEEDAKKMQPIIGCIFDHWFRLAEGRRTLLFAASVSQSQWIADQFNERGVPAAHVDGSTPTEERDELYAKLLDGSLTVVCNCNVLTEGNDLPSVEVCVNAAPTKSFRRWRQRTGRVMRAAPGKESCLIIDHTGSVYLHGAPNEDVTWSLNRTSKIERERQSKTKEKIRVCHQCFKVREQPGPQCEWCGAVAHTKANQPQVVKGKLSKYDHSKVPNKDLQKEWCRCLGRAAHQMGGTFWMARAMFHREMGFYPASAKFPNPKPWPEQHQFSMAVADLYPGFVKRKDRVELLFD